MLLHQLAQRSEGRPLGFIPQTAFLGRLSGTRIVPNEMYEGKEEQWGLEIDKIRIEGRYKLTETAKDRVGR